MNTILEFLKSPKFYLPILYFCIAVLVYGAFRRVLSKIFSMKLSRLDSKAGNYKKAETLRVLIQNVGKCLIAAIMLLAILTVYGINIANIVAGLGVVGVVIGLALQDTLKDFFSGISIILENQFAIGDNIEVTGFRGEVIFLGLKTTKIKSYQGSIKILANRNITEVINHSMEPSRAMVDVSVSYEMDLEHVEKILTNLASELTVSLENLQGEVEILGITNLDKSAITYRLTVLTDPVENFQTERKIRKAIKTCFTSNKIKIPYPQIEVHNGNK